MAYIGLAPKWHTLDLHPSPLTQQSTLNQLS